MSISVHRFSQATDGAVFAEGALPTEPLHKDVPTLVYWDICGLGEACRLALAFAVRGYDDVRIQAGRPDSAGYKSAWLAAKPGLVASGMAFANLPYYLDGPLKLTQSNAILRHIQRTSEAFASFDATTAAVVDMALDQLVDADNALTGYCYRGSPDSIGKLLAKMDSHLAAFELQLCNSNPSANASTRGAFVSRQEPSIADFKLYELVRKTRLIAQEMGGASAADPIARFERLQQHLAAVEALPAIRAYLDSVAYQARPLNNPTAHWM